MRVKPVPGKVILMLCIVSFLAGSLFSSRTSIHSSEKLNTVTHDYDHKRKLVEGSSGDIMGEVTKTHQAIQLLDKTISTLEMELAAARTRKSGSHLSSQRVSNHSSLQKAFVVIGINTAFSSKKRRDSVRETWMPGGDKLKKLEKEKGIIIRFVIGHSATKGGVLDRAIDAEETENKDFLRLKHVEGYHELSTKTRLYFSTAVSLWDAEFYVKVDDDVHVNLGMLVSTLARYRSKPRIYIGCMKSGPVLSQKGLKYHEPEFWKFGEEGNKYFRHATGQIYAISKDLAAYISTNSPILHRYANEDVSLGSWFIGLEVEHVDDRSMCCGTPPGWSGNPVCRKRYHFIIRRCNGLVKQIDEGEGGSGYHKACTMCGNLLHLLDSRCKSCNYVITADDIEDWVYLQFEDTSHLLHGVVHSNGYGHLLTLNGREGGSSILLGRDIMNFWDNLCKTLAVRKVSVMDVSKKYGLEYRLLHAITKGHSWYGNWGYEFGAGSYALTLDAYRKAVEILANTPLSLFYFQGRRSQTRLQAVITFYQSISDTELVSLSDLFSSILRLIHESHKSTKNDTCKEPKCATTNVLCAWTRNDVESVEQAMIKLLLAAAPDTSWVSRRALKGALCKVTSPEQLDYCLKHLGGKMAANGMVVNTRCNPSSSAVEFRLEPFGFVPNQAGSNSNRPSDEHLIHDLKFLSDSILHPLLSYRPQAKRELVDSATKLLDCKQFVKDYKPDRMAATRPSALYLWCHVEVADHPKDDPAPPPELLILPQNASVADLKLEATKAFQEVYALFKRLEIDELLDYGPLDDSMTLKLLVGSTGSVRVRGRCLGTHGLNRFRMERGLENWTVDCTCGAKDDDGERMLACDTCGIWQHTRCAGIDYYDAIPAKFICMRCLNSNREASNKDAQFDEAAKMAMLSSRTCRNEAAATNTSELGSSLTRTFGVPLV